MFYLLVCFAIGLFLVRSWSVALLAPLVMGVTAYLVSPIGGYGLRAYAQQGDLPARLFPDGAASALVPSCFVIIIGIALSVAAFAMKRLLRRQAELWS